MNQELKKIKRNGISDFRKINKGVIIKVVDIDKKNYMNTKMQLS